MQDPKTAVNDASIPMYQEQNKKETKRRISWLQPQKAISKKLYLSLSISSFILILLVWSGITYTHLVDPLFLPTPTDIINSAVTLFTELGFATDILATISRVFVGFLLALIIGLPLGVLIGTFKVVEAFFEPVISFVRYMPVSAFIPLFILWIGVEEPEKLAVIFVGSFFSLVLMIAVEVGNVRKELLEAAYTLGSTNFGIIKSVILPAAMPGIMEITRLVLGWAWTYIIVAELIAAPSGIGHVIIESQRMIRTSNIIFGIIVIGILGLICDVVLKIVTRKLFSWNYGR
ncbi:ABC transporter permease [Terrilactibacillus tamarindi]|nr:ABC transporter permease [Terrilactibacillus tamarindi]